MKAILFDQPGGADQLYLGEAETPKPAPDEILIKVAATALNRADIMQREGKYPPPEGASPILGLEVSGEVAECGESVSRWKKGDQVFSLLPGGGYAEYAIMHEAMALPVPSNLSLAEAAAIPEVFLTAFQALRWLSRLQPGEKLLIHAGASGVGTAAIQLGREMAASDIIVTASAAKHETCLKLGATHAIDYKNADFEEEVDKLSPQGVDVIIDFVAGPYFEKNINCLKRDGRLVLLATLGGGKVKEFNLLKLLSKRLQITASTLRSRSRDYQVRLSQEFAGFALERFGDGRLKPVIDSVFSWEQVREAHQRMESNQNTGKIVLEVG
ncbi:MAG: NAD(P)H-quinone oxidoreductase [Cyclobacteriaceae bacterium]